MDYSKCTGSILAIEYNVKYLDNVKLACYCPHCNLTTEREATPYKIIKTKDEYIEIIDKDYKEAISDEDEEEIDPTDAYDYIEGENEDC